VVKLIMRKIIGVSGVLTVLCTAILVLAKDIDRKEDKDRIDKQREYVAKEGALPLVLGIPGFMVPGVTIAQEHHFGKLKDILAEAGIPYYCITYDSAEYPLRGVADLASDTYSIAATRVIPSIVRAVKLEQERRRKNKLPPVQDVIMFMYSQGTVLSYSFVRQLHYFRREYNNFSDMFGIERQAIKDDPQFKSFIYAIDNFTLIKNIQVQREKDFVSDPDLRLFYDRTLEEMNRKYKEFESYLINPKSVYPQVTEFEPPESAKYPKQYIKLKEYALKCRKDPKEKEKFLNFIKDYSLLYDLKEINFMYFSVAGSIFGSPAANSGYELLANFPVGQMIVKGMNQIKDTRLGSFHHTRKIENLIRESKLPDYPITKHNTLFVVGCNGSRGDDLVDQPSAHISGHCYIKLDMSEENINIKKNGVIKPAIEQLPELHVVPLKVHHFPVKTFWGLGPTLPGAAYMEKGHPVLDYLFAFIKKDFNQIEHLKENNKVYMRQFMVEFTFRHITEDAETDIQIAQRRERLLAGLLPQFIKNLDVQVVKRPTEIHMQGKFFNADNLTYVLVGSYDEGLFQSKPKEEVMDFRIRAAGYDPVTLSIPIKPGKIMFVNVKLKEIK